MDITVIAHRHIPAPAHEVYAVMTDPDRFPFPGFGPIAAIRKVSLDGPLAVGSVRTLLGADGSELSERITALDPPRRHTYELSGFTPPFSWLVRVGVADWTVRDAGDGVDVTWSYRFTLSHALAWPVAAPLLAIFMRGAMTRCLDAIASMLARPGRG